MNYDLAIIGAGWAGFNAAVTAKGLGLSVALIDAAELGGTCLNRGCIPTKALIHSGRVNRLINKSQTFGIEIAQSRLDFSRIQERKEKIVQQLRQGMQSPRRGQKPFLHERRVRVRQAGYQQPTSYRSLAKKI